MGLIDATRFATERGFFCRLVVCRDLRLCQLAILCQARITKSPGTITGLVYRVAPGLRWPRRSDLRAVLDSVVGECAAAHAKPCPFDRGGARAGLFEHGTPGEPQ